MKPTVLYPLSMVAVLFAMPVLADDATAPQVTDTEISSVPIATDIVSPDPTSAGKPQVKFPHGVQIGMGHRRPVA